MTSKAHKEYCDAAENKMFAHWYCVPCTKAYKFCQGINHVFCDDCGSHRHTCKSTNHAVKECLCYYERKNKRAASFGSKAGRVVAGGVGAAGYAGIQTTKWTVKSLPTVLGLMNGAVQLENGLESFGSGGSDSIASAESAPPKHNLQMKLR